MVRHRRVFGVVRVLGANTAYSLGEEERMQRLQIQLDGDGDVHAESKRTVTDDVAIGLYLKLHGVLHADGGKRRGRKPTEAASDDESNPNETGSDAET